MPQHRAALLLGSNIDAARHLPAAISALSSFDRVLAVSRVWQSAAIGDATQADYCNVAVLWQTSLTPIELTAHEGPLRRIEQQLGRVRDPHNKFAARPIDIDLCLFDRSSLSIGERRLPNPDLFERACAAVPLAELPGVELPETCASTLASLAATLRRQQTLTPRPDIDAAIAAVLPSTTISLSSDSAQGAADA